MHLLTAFETNGRTVIAGSDALQKYAARATAVGRSPKTDKGAKVHPFAQPGGTRRLLERLGPDLWPELGRVTDQPLAKALSGSITQMLDIRGLRAGDVARALGGPGGAQHLLRLTLTSPEGELVGGYSFVVGAFSKPG